MMKIALSILMLLITGVCASAQPVGQLPSGTVWGNASASRAPASAATMTGLIDRAISGTQGAVMTRDGSAWIGLAPGTAGLPLLSGGAGANLAYGILGMAAGGSGANLTASNGGIIYSGPSSLAVLSGTATARQMLQSGASGAPAWSTTTWPATTTVNRLLWSSAANVISDLATANNGTLITSGTGVPSISSTLPAAVQANITGTGTLTSGATGIGFTVALSSSTISGNLPCANMSALTGDISSTAGSCATTLATVNSNVGSFGSATQVGQFTVNAKGLVTAASNVTVTPALSSITGFGTGVATFLATPSSANLRAALTDETGTGSAYFQGGALGTPSSGTLTNVSGLPAATGLTGQVPIANGGTGQPTAAAARGSSGLNVESVHQTGDAAVTIAATTRNEQTTTTLTAARTWTLPAASALNAGQSLIISDAAGAINGANVINVTRAGSDTINGTTVVSMTTQYQQLTLISDGVSKWTYNAAGGGGGTGTVTSVVCNGGTTTITTSGTCASREILSANRTYYVRTDGSDSNTCLANTAGGACLTIQAAVDKAVALDLSIYNVTIQVGDGTYTGAVNLKSYIGVGPITIQGNTGTPANVLISTTSASAITADSVRGDWYLNGMKVATTTSGNGIYANGGSHVHLSNVYFGACVNSHIRASEFANVTYDTDYTISGGAQRHWLANNGGKFSSDGAAHTITLTGTPAFSIAFVDAQLVGIVQANGQTFSGSATGKRYSATLNAVIDTIGGGASYFPGNSAGTTATGGQYQ